MSPEGRHDEDYSHEVVTIGSPAAGQGFLHTVPGASRQRIRSVSFVLVNAVAVANRLPRVEFLDASGAVFYSAAAPFVTTSGVTSRFNFAVGVTQLGANDAAQIQGALPSFKLNAGLSIRVAIGAVNAADQISGASLFVDQWAVRD